MSRSTSTTETQCHLIILNGKVEIIVKMAELISTTTLNAMEVFVIATMGIKLLDIEFN